MPSSASGERAGGDPLATGSSVAEVSTPADRPAGPLRRLARRLVDGLHEPEQVLALVLLIAFATRAVWLSVPQSLIFDESYYVNASRVILGWEVAEGAHYAGEPAGLDPNREHPPLGKLAMAASMAVFGDNGLGWRIPSLIAAMVALWALFLVVRAAGESAWLGVLAVAIFAFDNLAFVHGRIGTLDMLVLAPLLLGAWAGLRGRWLAAGALMGLGLLVKLTALYGLLALLILAGLALLAAWRRERRLRFADLRPGLAAVAGFVVVVGAGLWVLDVRFTTFTNPLDHLRHMLEYGANLHRAGDLSSNCPSNDSAPWQWLINDCQMTYYRVSSSSKVGEEIVATFATIDFRGAMNPVLLGAIAFAVPFAAWSAVRERNRLATWAVVWMGASYLPYIPLAIIGQRITYLYYFLPVVPALGAAIALLLHRSSLPRPVVWGFFAAYLIGYVAYFPFRRIP